MRRGRRSPGQPFDLHWLLERTKVVAGCWEWQGAQRRAGYGTVSWRRAGRLTSTAAHRFVYELLVGPVPKGWDLYQVCRNRTCVKPTHLEPVTHAVNLRRTWEERNSREQRAAA